MTRVGFVGLGDIGGPMACRLAERFDVVVWARRPAMAMIAVEAGARQVDRLAELGTCDVIGVCVTNGAAVRTVVEGLLPTLTKGAVICVHSTVHPYLLEQLSDSVCSAGGALVDAPVSGGSDGASAGHLRVMVGGDPDPIERCREVLEQLGTVLVMGRVGSGQQTKLLNNALYAAQLALARDVLSIAMDFGLDPDQVIDAIGGASGASFALGRLGRVTHPSRVGHVSWLLGKDLALFERVAGAGSDAIARTAWPFLTSLGSVRKQEVHGV